MSFRVGVLGSTGLVGEEVVNLLNKHDEFDVVYLASRDTAQKLNSEVAPVLRSRFADKVFVQFDPETVPELDFLFCALPHNELHKIAPTLAKKVKHLVDLSADFRVHPEIYETYYEKHSSPELYRQFSFGLPELFRQEIAKKPFVAIPGCYSTAVILAMAPILSHRTAIVSGGVGISATSGITGLGRKKYEQERDNYDGQTVSYGLLDVHRHVPEIEEIFVGIAGRHVPVSMVAHTVPMERGITATCFFRNANGIKQPQLLAIFEEFYADEPFVEVISRDKMSTKEVEASHKVLILPRYDERSGLINVVSLICNLGRPAGNAIAAANNLAGLPEGMGLSLLPLE